MWPDFFSLSGDWGSRQECAVRAELVEAKSSWFTLRQAQGERGT